MQLTRQVIHELLETAWRKEHLPEEWRTGIICSLHKKEDLMKYSNYRGISFLNTAYNIFTRILYIRLLPYVQEVIGNYQTAFHRGKSTIDQIFIIKQILEKHNRA